MLVQSGVNINLCGMQLQTLTQRIWRIKSGKLPVAAYHAHALEVCLVLKSSCPHGRCHTSQVTRGKPEPGLTAADVQALDAMLKDPKKTRRLHFQWSRI